MSALSYQQCYEILALQNHADWTQAETSYRQLVQLWHPDRYRGSDTEEATRRYIEITKAFKKLRDFHKENDSLPFSSVDSITSSDTSPTSEQQKHDFSKPQNNQQDSKLSDAAGNNSESTDAARSDLANARWKNNERFRPSRFAFAISAVFVVGVAVILLFMTKLDRINSDKIRDEARLERMSEHLVEQQDTHQ